MITKQSFISILEAIKKQDKRDDKTSDALNSLLVDSMGFYETPLVSDIINILAKEFNQEEDKYVGNDISYFIYDLDWGKDGKDAITLKDGSKVSITTPEELYDWLVSNN